MTTDMHEQIISGIRTYLETKFPGVEFAASNDVKRHSVILSAAGRPRYRLEITARFLSGDEGVQTSLKHLHEWDVAEALRGAKNKLVTLATTGLHTSNPRQYAVAPRRRHS